MNLQLIELSCVSSLEESSSSEDSSSEEEAKPAKKAATAPAKKATPAKSKYYWVYRASRKMVAIHILYDNPFKILHLLFVIQLEWIICRAGIKYKL